jgi:hypothetical protein
MSDVDNTDGRGGQDDGDFTSKVIPIADARMRLEQLEPKATPLPNTAVAESSPASDWPEPDLSVLRLNRRPPPNCRSTSLATAGRNGWRTLLVLPPLQ